MTITTEQLNESRTYELAKQSEAVLRYERDQARAKLAASEANNVRMQEALKPFQKVGVCIEDTTTGFLDSDAFDITFEDSGFLFDKITVADFRRARAALDDQT